MTEEVRGGPSCRGAWCACRKRGPGHFLAGVWGCPPTGHRSHCEKRSDEAIFGWCGRTDVWIAAPSPHSARKMARNDRFGVCRGAKPLCRGVWGCPRFYSSISINEGRGLNLERCYKGAAGRCREFEGVPQVLSSFYPPRLGGQRWLTLDSTATIIYDIYRGWGHIQ
jgi:hypothetical protein